MAASTSFYIAKQIASTVWAARIADRDARMPNVLKPHPDPYYLAAQVLGHEAECALTPRSHRCATPLMFMRNTSFLVFWNSDQPSSSVPLPLGKEAVAAAG